MTANLLQNRLSRAAERSPDKEAVRCGRDSLSYADLHQHSSKLAVVLRERGVGGGDRVGIYVNKSIASVVAVHATLKAGGVYVPIDPHSPVARTAYILRDCGIRHLLMSSSKAGDVRRMFDDRCPLQSLLLLDGESLPDDELRDITVPWTEIAARAAPELAEPARNEQDLAYILYTSGSTGAPKGVMISHRAANRFVDWACDRFALGPGDRISNHAPLHFDLSIFDIFGAFSAEATLVLVPEGTSTFPIRLADWIEDNRVSVWYSVPSVLSLLAMRGRLERHSFRHLRAILFAGEVFPVKYLRKLMQRIPHAAYYNLYGPTETNVITCYEVKTLEQARTAPVPIGKACASASLSAKRADGKPVTKPGEEGELYARGAIVAEGYWNDAEKTHRSFSRGGSGPDDRTYATGDLVSLDESGNWIFLGRLDDMIKSRGYRIELGEIEAALYAHSDVYEAAAVAVPDELVGNRIRAFVVPVSGAAPVPRELKSFCGSRLPTYMVPEAIELRDQLPRTSTGKVDRTALAKPS